MYIRLVPMLTGLQVVGLRACRYEQFACSRGLIACVARVLGAGEG